MIRIINRSKLLFSLNIDFFFYFLFESIEGQKISARERNEKLWRAGRMSRKFGRCVEKVI